MWSNLIGKKPVDRPRPYGLFIGLYLPYYKISGPPKPVGFLLVISIVGKFSLRQKEEIIVYIDKTTYTCEGQKYLQKTNSRPQNNKAFLWSPPMTNT